MTTTLCISGQALLKAGKNVSTDLSTGTSAAAKVDQFINEAECYINSITKYNWIDAYGSLNADYKLLLQNICSNLAGMYCINYHMGSYTSRGEAETMLDVLWANVQQGLKRLEEEKIRDFVIGA